MRLLKALIRNKGKVKLLNYRVIWKMSYLIHQKINAWDNIILNLTRIGINK